MASADRELEKKLLEAGKVLLEPPSSADELISQLDRVGKLLGKVEQSPSASMLEALSPTIKAAVDDKLLKNQNEDVRVAVASCISEITRITAPEAPYDDSQMKEVFQLIVSSFENLSDNTGPSYSKRTSILETVAKVRSCVVMLDLECNELIIEMFQHFLKAIRDYHPENVFSNMEIIMNLVLEESEEIGLDLIFPILACLKKDNQEVRPVARKLAKNVIEKSAEKIKPCLLEAKTSTKLSFDDYSRVISRICSETNHTGHDNHKSSGEHLNFQIDEGIADGATSGVTTQGQVTKESTPEAIDGQDSDILIESNPSEDHSVPVETSSREDHPALVERGPGVDNSAPVGACLREEHLVPVESGPVEELPAPATPSKSATSNAVAETENETISAGPCSSEKPEHTTKEDQSLDEADVGGKAEPGNSESEKVEFKSPIISKKRSKKPKHLVKSTVPSESSYTDADVDKEAKQITDGHMNLDKEVDASPSRVPSIEVAVDKENGIDTEQKSSPKALETEPHNVFSPSSSGSALNEGRSRKEGRSKKKNKSSKKATPSQDVATEKAAGGTNDLKVKLQEQSGKEATASDSPVEKDQVQVKMSKVEGGSGSDSDAKVVKKSSKKKADTRDQGDGSSSKKKEAVSLPKPSKVVKNESPLEETPKTSSKRKRTPIAEKEVVSLPKPSKVVKNDSQLVEASKSSSKRKRTPTSVKATAIQKHGKDLVGTRIKVWWPMDDMFYEGVVDSFDPKNKKHKVMYTDGDVEELDLGKEKWELDEDGTCMEDGGGETKAGSAEASLEMKKKKKAKSGSEPLATKGKKENSRPKASAQLDRHTIVDISEDDEKEVTPKSSAKSEDVGGKSKDRSKKKSGKSSVDASEKAGKSNDEDIKKPKTSVKFKMASPKGATKDSPKTVVKDSTKSGSKSSTPKTGSKSGTNSAGKAKSGSGKSKEIVEVESSPETLKALKNGKGKSAEKETEKSGKKRKRS